MAEPGFMEPLEGGYTLSGVVMDNYRVTLELRRTEDLPEGPIQGRLVLEPLEFADEGAPRSKSFGLHIETEAADPLVRGHLEAALRSVQARDQGDFYVIRDELPLDQVDPAKGGSMAVGLTALASSFEERYGSQSRVAWRRALSGCAWAIGLALALLLLLGLGGWARGQRPSARLNVQRTHYLPATLQVVLFSYWALYWVDVRDHLPLVAAHLVFSYLFDGALAWARGRPWLIGLGPLPITFSTNLFVWFHGADAWLAFVVLAIGLGAKAFAHHRREHGGRHIFNPSALGISVVALMTMLWPETFGFEDISHPLSAPPHMMELILLLTLIPQLKVPIVLISLSALLVMLGLVESFEILHPAALWAPVFLALALLATDPATMPRSGLGKVLSGAFLGAAIVAMSSILIANGRDDFFTKVLAIPLANLLVPLFDKAGAALAALLGGVAGALEPRHNRWHVAAWLVAVVVGLYSTDSKRDAFEAAAYNAGEVRHLRLTSRGGGRPSCDHNRAWCEPFRLGDEVGLWFDDGAEGR